MGIARFSAIVLTVLVVLTSGSFASGFENSGIGMKARGMSGAFRAIADDWTAAYYNPAGYAWIWDNQLGSNWAFVHHRDEIVPDALWGNAYDRGIFNNQSNFNHHQVLSNPSAGFLLRLPLAGETVFGLSAFQRFDQNTSWRLFQPVPEYDENVTIPGDQFASNLDVVSFQLTAARELVPEKVAVGIGLQVMRADLIYSNVFFRTNPISNNPDEPLWDIMQDFPYDRITQWNKNDGRGWGFGFNAGVLLALNDKLRAGFSANIPFAMTISGEAQSEFYMPDNFYLWSESDSADIHNPGTVGQLFLSGAVVRPTMDFEADLDLPPSFGAGLAFQATDRLTLAFDAEYTLWSQYEGLYFKYSNVNGLFGPADTAAIARDFFSADVATPADWDNAAKLMFGFAYEFPQFLSPDLGLTVLGGASADQSPTRDEKGLTPQFMNTRNTIGFSLGGVLHLDRWDLGLVTAYAHQQGRNVTELSMDDTFQSLPGNYMADTYETILSFNYRF